MELKSLNCPNCGGSVNIPEGVSRFYCTYCGSQIQVDDGKITIDLNANITLDHRYTDVARLKELDLQEQDRKRQIEQRRIDTKRKICCVLTLLVSICVYFVGLYCIGNFENVMEKIGAIFSAIAAAAGPIASIIIAPQQWRSKTIIERPKGCIGCIVWGFVIMFIISFWFVAVIIPIGTAWS